MQFQHDEFLLLSRSGHVPRSAPLRQPHQWPRAAGPLGSPRRRLASLRSRLPAPVRHQQPDGDGATGARPVQRDRGGRLDIHEYLELEFTVDQRR